MTSYPACNKASGESLSREPCITDKKLLWNAIRKSWSLFQTGNDVLTTVSNKTSLSQKSCMADKKSLWIRIRHEKSCEAPQSREIPMSYSACKKNLLSLKPCIADKKLQLNSFMKSWSLNNFYQKKQQILIIFIEKKQILI